MKPGLFPILFGGQPKTLFESSLETTLVPQKAVSGTPTVSRTTTGTVVDFEGIPWTAKINESRLGGSLRGANLATSVISSWAVTSNTTVGSSVSDPLGGTGAYTITSTGGGSLATCYRASSIVFGASSNRINSIWIRRRTGTGSVSLNTGDNTINGGNGFEITSVITASWQIITYGETGIISGSSDYIGIHLGTNGDAVDVYIPLSEVITGKTNVNPLSYFSLGVLSAPYHGCGVDGVKYFGYQNGNTVASNVVTEAQGAAIPEATLKGYLSEGQRKNCVVQSQNFGTTWSAVGSPTRTAGNKKYGSLILDLIGDDSAVAVEGYTETITFTGNAQKSVSCFVKQGTATKSVIVLRDTTAAADRLNVEITWSGAVPVVTMITGTQERAQEAMIDGVYRLFFLTTSVTAANTNSLQVYPATDNALAILDTGNINIGGLQAEDDVFASSYIPTTTAAVTKTIDSLSYPVDANLNTTGGAILVTFTPTTATAFTGYIYGSYTDANNSFQLFFDGTTLTARKRVGGTSIDATIGFVYTVGTTYKIAVNYGSNGIDVFLNGVKGTGNATTTAPVFGANFHIGTDGNAGNAAFGFIKNLKFYNKKLKDSKLIQLTT